MSAFYMKGDECVEIKYCRRCGRKLRSDESRERGYGKTCWEKAQNKLKPLFILNDKND